MEMVKCEMCDYKGFSLLSHIPEKHGVSLGEYTKTHPNAPTVCQQIWKSYLGEAHNIKRTSAIIGSVRINFAGVPIEVNADVDASACLPLPEHYRIPIHGSAATKVKHAAIALANGRSTYIWGLPGAGKDAIVHAFSHMARRPAEIFTIQPGANLERWFYVRGFSQEGTEWQEGRLLKILRDGYTTASGQKVPYLVLISDFDRATPEQAEIIRLNLDTIQRRVKGPCGETYEILPGSQFVFTANSSGSGDYRRRCISSNPLDSSLLDRIERKFQFHWMEWEDEEPVLRLKFPYATRRVPNILNNIGAATSAIRDEILNNDAFYEFSHRTLCNWISHAEDLLRLSPQRVPPGLLGLAAECWLDGLPDKETREEVVHLIDSHIEGGAIKEGDTSHFEGILDPSDMIHKYT